MDTNINKRISLRLNEHLFSIKELNNNKFTNFILRAVSTITDAIKNGNKILVAGNGGSSCDAQHMVGEFIGKFMHERVGLPAICLCNDIASTYAIGNDYDFEYGISRSLEALGKKGDVFIAFSTSGNSVNILNAVKFASIHKIKIILLLGKDGGKLYKSGMYDLIYIPKNTNSTPRIQEIHEFIMHTICEEVELNFKNKKSKVFR